MGEIRHSIKYPSGIGTMIGMTAYILISTILVIRIWDDRGIFLYAMLTAELICLIVLLHALYITLKQPTEAELYLYNNQILLSGRTIQAVEIKVIMRKGYFKPVIGVLPHGKKIVPIYMAFRFSKDEDRGISDLINWAEKNNVKVVNKEFKTWI